MMLPLLLALLTLPQTGVAQSQRRWLSDPELLTWRGEGGVLRQVGNRIIDIDLADERTGWAVDTRGLQRFDGRFWRPAVDYGSMVNLIALDLSSATSGWAVGSAFIPGGPNAVYFARLIGTEWTITTDVILKDGSTGLLRGNLLDVAVQPDNTALAVGSAFDADFRTRPLVVFFDGLAWRDVTPDAWRDGYLTSVSITGPTEVWVGGTLGVIGGSGSTAPRPLLARVQDSIWSEASVPELAPEVRIDKVIMRNSSEGWAIAVNPTVRCSSQLLRYSDGEWHDISLVLSPLKVISALALIPGTNRGWLSLADCGEFSGQRMRFDDGVLTRDATGAQLMPHTYALLNDDVQWAASEGAMLRYSDERLPTERVAGAGPGVRYFPTTGHTLSGPFRQYYETHGLELGDRGVSDREALALFGYPLSETFTEINPDTGELLQVQYFERARFEYHPENPEPYKVLLGRLGVNTLIRLNRAFGPDPIAPPPGPNCAAFDETPFALCPPFRAFWERSGGLPVFGFPITAAADEISATDGQRYRTQWFERERLEDHPEHRGTAYAVQLGLLGAEELRLRGYMQ
jgi:hypothetical protein